MPLFSYLVLVVLALYFSFYSLNALAYKERGKLSNPALIDDHTGKIVLTLPTKSFIDNTEYFNKIMEGGTIFGFHFMPSLTCLIVENMGIDLGLVWRKRFGDKNPWNEIRPALSTFYKKKQTAFVIGIFRLQDYPPTLLEPLLNPHQLLRRPFMEGLYFRVENHTSYLAGWLDWLTLLAQKKEKPESFTFHLDAGYRGLNLPKTVGFAIPFQLAIYHLGGQGIAVKSYSLFCGASGLALTFMPPNSFCKQINWASYLLCNRYVKEIDRPFKKGWGQLHSMDCCMSFIGLSLSYWQGANFSSENMGHPLYQSIRIEDNKVIHHEKTRRLLLLSVYKDWMPYPSVSIEAACRPYYDFTNQLFEYGLSCTLSYSFHCQLTKLPQTSGAPHIP